MVHLIGTTTNILHVFSLCCLYHVKLTYQMHDLAALNLWNEMRQQWVGDRPRNQARQLREPALRYPLMVHVVELLYI